MIQNEIQVYFLGLPSEGGYLDDVGEDARFTKLRDVYQKNENELIVADTDNHCLRKIERYNGNLKTTHSIIFLIGAGINHFN